MAKENKLYDTSLHRLNSQGKVYVGIPRERVYIPSFVDNRDQIIHHLQQLSRAAGYFQAEGHRVDRNRDRITYEFKHHEHAPEWLQFLDSDMTYPKDIAERLTAWEKPIVGGLYFHRGDTHDPFVFMKGKVEYGGDLFGRERQQWRPMRDEVYDWLRKNNVPMREGAVAIGDPGQVGLIECDAVATGAMLIHRSVIETMEPPWFEYKTGGHSEDLIFCDDAKFEYGIPIHCDLSTIAGHYHWKAMGQGEFQQNFQNRGVKLSLFTMSEMARLMGEFFDEPAESTFEELKNGNAHMVGSYWRSKKPKTAEEVREFYEDPHTGRLYMIELAHWNASTTFARFKQELVFARDLDVLEIGSGIGSAAMQLAIQRCNVIAGEVNDTLREFSKFRWKKAQDALRARTGKIDFVKDIMKHGKKESVDLIVAFDVIEHMPAEDVKQFLLMAGDILKQDGGMIFHNNWEQQDLYPMHFDHSEQWEKWLAEAGLVQISPIRAIKVATPEEIKNG